MRRKNTYTVEAPGRDKGKVFVLTELPAWAGADWALRALRLAQRAKVDIPGGLNAGMAGVAALGILTVLQSADDFEQLRPLLKEMMDCVVVMTDPKTQFTRPLVEDGISDDIEEIGTYFLLRKEWLDLHLDFSIADALSKLTSATTSSAN